MSNITTSSLVKIGFSHALLCIRLSHCGRRFKHCATEVFRPRDFAVILRPIRSKAGTSEASVDDADFRSNDLGALAFHRHLCGPRLSADAMTLTLEAKNIAR
jgi:hypothetical protein